MYMKNFLFLLCFALFTCYINNNLDPTLAEDYIEFITSLSPYIDMFKIIFLS